MNQYETDSNGALVDTAPLFASVWLAFYYALRNNLAERRLAAAANTGKTEPMEKN